MDCSIHHYQKGLRVMAEDGLAATGGGEQPKNRQKRPLVGDAFMLDATVLSRRGVMEEPGSWWIISYRKGDAVLASLGVEAVKDGSGSTSIHMKYIVGLPGGEEMPIDRTIPLHETPCNFGGVRYRFCCQGHIGQGRLCNRRVPRLYLPRNSDLFACRWCHGLEYACRELHRNQLFEKFLRPKKALEQAAHVLDRARSETKKKAAFEKAQAAMASLQEFQSWVDQASIKAIAGHLRKTDRETLSAFLNMDLMPITMEFRRAKDRQNA